MLFIFGWAINTDVKHVTTAVFDQAGSVEARTLLEALDNSRYFDIRHRAGSQRQRAGGRRRLGSPGGHLSMNAATALAAARSLAILTETTGAWCYGATPPGSTSGCGPGTTPDLVSAIFIVPG
jgi:hypothetical protein